MPRKRYRPEDILSKLREADILISQGRTVAETIRVLGISDVTCWRWGVRSKRYDHHPY